MQYNSDKISEYSGYEIMVHFDGSCNPNPGGHASYGFKINTLSEVGYDDHGYIGHSKSMTNNLAEWAGLKAALGYLLGLNGELKGDKILIFGDSQLVIRQLTGRWRVKAKHLEIFKSECLELLELIGLPWEARWIPRCENAEADALAEQATRNVLLRSHNTFQDFGVRI